MALGGNKKEKGEDIEVSLTVSPMDGMEVAE